MKKLIKSVKSLVTDEYGRATEVFGPANNSPHESYAVILEEYEEAQNGTHMFGINLSGFWKAVKANTATNCQLETMQRIAEEIAAEWIQVAAMCHKATIPKDGDAK